ncbi:NUDIX hydrolase [Salipiger sp. IMCC34102]|uniref:NUDIX hydrolase n=1 Tax=Salipiger sp. IMCC34102 TaxID=2510647 RepID=UPI00101DE60B|nr:NUDIX hydrolase [Salipiger sp. IMCC34102]RYH01931.1 NUDIX hydrolase [Salipiger sp. IMCC34102]
MVSAAPTDPAIRDAATVIVIRRDPDPAVLMGQRGAAAVFMPDKFVFPGGRVEDCDAGLPGPALPDAQTKALSNESLRPPRDLACAAIRELYEETGQILGTPAPWPDAPPPWQAFAATGHHPDPQTLRYFFRAVTPQGRPRRFDARFFLAEAEDLASDPDDFATADGELSHLRWIPLPSVRDLDLPFITQVALRELIAHLADPQAPLSIPYFRNDDERHLVTRLGGKSPI